MVDLCQQQSNYIDVTIQIVQNSVKPFLFDKSTDAEVYSAAIVAFYSDFGKEND